MARFRTSFSALMGVALMLGAGACGRGQGPTVDPTDASEDQGLVLRYATGSQTITQDVELQLTQTQLGLYVEADLAARAELTLAGDDPRMRTRWSVLEVSALELDGSVESDEVERVRTLVRDHGRGTTIGDVAGVLDTAATEAEPTNVTRVESLAANSAAGAAEDDAPPDAGAVLVAVLAEQMRLPRLPAAALVLGTPTETEEESETLLAGTGLVLPTTTVHRFTLTQIDVIDATRVAEIEVLIASVAQTEPPPEPAEPAEADDDALTAQIDSRTTGTLVFDLDRGLPVSLELSRTDSFRVGERELERSVQFRSTYAVAPAD